jgi:ribonuclease Z
MGFSATDVEAVFLTHFHSDHIDGLGALTLNHWGQHGARAPLPLYGGEGVDRIAAGVNEEYTLDSTYRIAHHGPNVVPPSGFGLTAHPFAIPAGQQSVVVLDDGGVRITAFNVNHGPVHPAFGYRIDYAGRSIVISGDTTPAPELVHQAENVDLLVHEALSPRLTNIMQASATRHNQTGLAHIFHDILNYHTTPEQAAEEAEQAHAKALALTHIIPPLPISILEGPFLGDARSRYHGPLWIMHDGDLISLPRSGGIVRRHLL